MPTAISYPGVYVEELPSGVRTTTGVSTSTTAFAGWLPKGPTDRAQLILSWADFERQFSGLNVSSLVSYAVRHFFNNGGSQAYIIRLAANNAATATLDGKLKISARDAGDWGNSLAVSSQRNSAGDRFSLTVFAKDDEGTLVQVEAHVDLGLDAADKRFVGRVLQSNSRLIAGELVGTPTTPPANQTQKALTGGADGDVLEPDNSSFETALLPNSEDSGVYHLDRVDLFNLFCVPWETKPAKVAELQDFCRKHRAFLIVDCEEEAGFDDVKGGPDPSVTGNDAIKAAFCFPMGRCAGSAGRKPATRVSTERLRRWTYTISHRVSEQWVRA